MKSEGQSPKSNVVAEPFVGNLAKHVNDDVLEESLQKVSSEYCIGRVLGEYVVIEATREDVPR